MVLAHNMCIRYHTVTLKKKTIILFGCARAWLRHTLSCSIWDLVSRPGIEPGPPALAAWGLGHWATRQVPDSYILIIPFLSSLDLSRI